MSLEVVPLREMHLEDAASLASVRYSGLCEQVPPLPPRYAQVSTLLPLLRDIAKAGPAVAAIRGRRLVGFVSGWLLPSFRGRRSAFSPEWANAAALEDSRCIYEAMYTRISAAWAAEGCLNHLISLLANDPDAVDCYHWLGFGMIAADAVRDLRSAPGCDVDVGIRRAGLQDLDRVLALKRALRQHLAAAPVFLFDIPSRASGADEAWLQGQGRAAWLAYRDTEAVAYMELGPADDRACTIIIDEKTAKVNGAFTQEQARGEGIATALLNQGLEWARAAGYERCAVDFEPMNPPAARFWLRHFEPVCYTLVRHLDPSAA